MYSFSLFFIFFPFNFILHPNKALRYKHLKSIFLEINVTNSTRICPPAIWFIQHTNFNYHIHKEHFNKIGLGIKPTVSKCAYFSNMPKFFTYKILNFIFLCRIVLLMEIALFWNGLLSGKFSWTSFFGVSWAFSFIFGSLGKSLWFLKHIPLIEELPFPFSFWFMSMSWLPASSSTWFQVMKLSRLFLFACGWHSFKIPSMLDVFVQLIWLLEWDSLLFLCYLISLHVQAFGTLELAPQRDIYPPFDSRRIFF